MAEIIKIMEIIGTVAFALSGALVSISSGLDVFGVIFLACITAFGGGMLRDVFLGINIPTIFCNFPIFALAIAVALFAFVIAYIYKEKFNTFKVKIEAVNNIFDAIGLAAFVVIGCETACSYGYLSNGFFVVFSGMITGVGGGMLRDVLIDTTPYIFKKHVYAVAAIIGGVLYFILRSYTKNVQLASLLSVIFVFVIRMLATKYRWSLPKVQISRTGDLNEKT